MSDQILISSTTDGTPIGPTNAVDMVVSSAKNEPDSVDMVAVAAAAKVAADAAIADSTASFLTPSGTVGTLKALAERRSRPKIIAAKTVLLSKPNAGMRKTNPVKRGTDTSRTSQAKQGKQKVPTKSTHKTMKKPTDISSRTKKSASSPTKKSTASPTKKSTASPTKKSNKKSKPVSSPVKNQTKSATKKAPKSAQSTPSSLEVFCGVPTEKFEYSWAGWTKRTFQRQNGVTKGTMDSYWYTPKMQYKLRSLAQVRRFHQCMQSNQNDEVKAYKAMKG